VSRKIKRLMARLLIAIGVGLTLLIVAWFAEGGVTRELLIQRSPDGKYEAVATVDTYGGLVARSYYEVTIYAVPRRKPWLNILGGIGGSPHAMVWFASEGDKLTVTWQDNGHLSISCLQCAGAKLTRDSWNGLRISHVNKPFW
jgi:hypothetical protein